MDLEAHPGPREARRRNLTRPPSLGILDPQSRRGENTQAPFPRPHQSLHLAPVAVGRSDETADGILADCRAVGIS